MEDVDINESPEVASLKFSKEVMDLLGEIDKQDKNNISEVKTEMDKLKEDMRDLQTQTKVIKNYGTFFSIILWKRLSRVLYRREK